MIRAVFNHVAEAVTRSCLAVPSPLVDAEVGDAATEVGHGPLRCVPTAFAAKARSVVGLRATPVPCPCCRNHPNIFGGSVFPLPPWLQHCFCLVCSAASVAKTMPLCLAVQPWWVENPFGRVVIASEEETEKWLAKLAKIAALEAAWEAAGGKKKGSWATLDGRLGQLTKDPSSSGVVDLLWFDNGSKSSSVKLDKLLPATATQMAEASSEPEPESVPEAQPAEPESTPEVEPALEGLSESPTDSTPPTEATETPEQTEKEPDTVPMALDAESKHADIEFDDSSAAGEGGGTRRHDQVVTATLKSKSVSTFFRTSSAFTPAHGPIRYYEVKAVKAGLISVGLANTVGASTLAARFTAFH